MKILDEQELTIRISEIDNRLDAVYNAATHAYMRANEANDTSKIAINNMENARIAAVSYQSVIDQLQARVTDLEHKMKMITGPCYCESLL
nr:MAG TPA: hypothetical protein [Caudoviricetes sp.]